MLILNKWNALLIFVASFDWKVLSVDTPRAHLLSDLGVPALWFLLVMVIWKPWRLYR